VQGDDNAEKNHGQAKKPFYVREIDASLLRRNAELSKNARHLHGCLRAMADAKTGELRVGNHWWTPAEICREAELCERNRKTAMRELVAAGLAHAERERRTLTVKDRLTGNLRKRHVLGLAYYFVSPIPRPDWLSSTVQSQNPNTDACSSKVQKLHRRRKPHKDRVSSTVHHDIPEKDSSTVQFLHGAKNAPSILISEAPKDLQPSASSLPVDPICPIAKGGASQDSPAPTPTAPPPISIQPEYQYPPQAKGIAETLESSLRAYAREHPGENIPVWKLQVWRKYHLAETDALGIPFAASIALYERIVREFLTPAVAPQPKPKEAWENPTLDASRQVMDVLKTAGSTGCTSAFLADKVYGCGMERAQEEWQDRQSRYRAQGRIVQIIARLRKKNWPIATIGDDSRSKRYVLQVN
jgi:hypothetical protein